MKEFRHNYSLISNDIIKSSLKNNNVNILLVNNDIHNYQNIFFNPEILRDDFIQIATIFKTKDLNKENLKKI